MLTIVCGEDSGSSRNYFLDIKQKARDRDCEVVDIDAKSIGEILTWMADAPTLFSSKKVFFTQSLNKNISKRSNPKYLETVEKIVRDGGSEVYDWEDNVPGRYLKIKEGVTVKEFKPDTSIFRVLDSCYPGNIKVFLDGVHDLSQGSEDIFTFIMLSRHVRNLMLVSLGQVPPGMPSWQAARLKGQAAKWTTEKLVSFYDNLHKIDASLKTGVLPYSLASALDILATFYL